MFNKGLHLRFICFPCFCCGPHFAVGSESDSAASLIPTWFYTFVEIDHEMISTVILLLPLIQEGMVSVTRQSMCTNYWLTEPGRVAQSVKCLATDACLTADPGVASLIPVRSHTFVGIDHEMISMVILLPSADSFK